MVQKIVQKMVQSMFYPMPTVPSFICPIFSFPFFFDVVLTLEIGVVRKASEVFNTNPSRDSPRGGNKPHYRY